MKNRNSSVKEAALIAAGIISADSSYADNVGQSEEIKMTNNGDIPLESRIAAKMEIFFAEQEAQEKQAAELKKGLNQLRKIEAVEGFFGRIKSFFCPAPCVPGERIDY